MIAILINNPLLFTVCRCCCCWWWWHVYIRSLREDCLFVRLSLFFVQGIYSFDDVIIIIIIILITLGIVVMMVTMIPVVAVAVSVVATHYILCQYPNWKWQWQWHGQWQWKSHRITCVCCVFYCSGLILVPFLFLWRFDIRTSTE